jgi:hypothetical protein
VADGLFNLLPLEIPIQLRIFQASDFERPFGFEGPSALKGMTDGHVG